jgi:hypothetical protein
VWIWGFFFAPKAHKIFVDVEGVELPMLSRVGLLCELGGRDVGGEMDSAALENHVLEGSVIDGREGV